MSIRSKLQYVRRRDWVPIRDAWLAHVPEFPTVGARPDPGLERLQPLLDVPLLTPHDRLADVPGLRTNLLWEAVFLFHKCAHSHLAAQRLGYSGMQSWCLFNAYHSAYLGAKSMMALLGVAFPNLAGAQVLVDVYPEAIGRAARFARSSFDEFVIVKMPPLDQRNVWEALQRMIRMTDGAPWDGPLREEVLNLSFEEITPPRNHFLYRAQFWPGRDLLTDAPGQDLVNHIGTTLDTGEFGFLLRLSFVVYRLVEQLFMDLATRSGVIAIELQASRIVAGQGVQELACYDAFVNS